MSLRDYMEGFGYLLLPLINAVVAALVSFGDALLALGNALQDTIASWMNALAEFLRVEENDEETDQAWLCTCGHYQEDGLHCECCGREPPWGCDCSFCQDKAIEDYDSEYPPDFDDCPEAYAQYDSEPDIP